MEKQRPPSSKGEYSKSKTIGYPVHGGESVYSQGEKINSITGMGVRKKLHLNTHLNPTTHTIPSFKPRSTTAAQSKMNKVYEGFIKSKTPSKGQESVTNSMSTFGAVAASAGGPPIQESSTSGVMTMGNTSGATPSHIGSIPSTTPTTQTQKRETKSQMVLRSLTQNLYQGQTSNSQQQGGVSQKKGILGGMLGTAATTLSHTHKILPNSSPSSLAIRSGAISAATLISNTPTETNGSKKGSELSIRIPSQTPNRFSMPSMFKKFQSLTTRHGAAIGEGGNMGGNMATMSLVDTTPITTTAKHSTTIIGNKSFMGLQIIIPNHEATKCSLKRNGVVRAYAANTNQGLVRNYNEDRVSIILNILKPPSRSNETWPKCSFFGVYDGHGGSACADFLRDNLHQFVIKEPSFPNVPKEALKNGFAAAEKRFLDLAYSSKGNNGRGYLIEGGIVDRSGSCSVVVLIVGEMCYVANVGDSRAILSGSSGSKIFPLTKDHKPNEDTERKRIEEAGGQIYQTATAPPKLGGTSTIIVGPHRVLPGRLSVSRTFGDPEAKIKGLGGNPNVIIALPDIKSFKIHMDHDFIVMGSDGIFDKLSNRESIQCVWNTVHDEAAPNIHQFSGLGVECILKNSLMRRTLDNVTVVIISFANFKKVACGRKKNKEGGGVKEDFNRTVTGDFYTKGKDKMRDNIPGEGTAAQTYSSRNPHMGKSSVNSGYYSSLGGMVGVKKEIGGKKLMKSFAGIQHTGVKKGNQYQMHLKKD